MGKADDSQPFRAQFVGHPPPSGECEEHSFSQSGPWRWFRFDVRSPDAWLEWYGAFGGGEGQLTDAFVLGSTGRAFVVSMGVGYFVDIERRAATRAPGTNLITSATRSPLPGEVIVADFTDLYALDDKRVVWKSGHVALDGFDDLMTTETGVQAAVPLRYQGGEDQVLEIVIPGYMMRWRSRE